MNIKILLIKIKIFKYNKMNKSQNKKNNKNKANIDIKGNKNQESAQKIPKSNPINIQAGAGVKLTVGNKLLEMEKNEQRVLELQKIIQRQENTIKILNQGVAPYNLEIENLKLKITELQNENNILKERDQNINLEIDNLKNRINEESTIKNELIESNKKLQQKIEMLNQELENIKYENKRDQEEYTNMCRVKSNFEDRIIQLSDELEKNRIKLQTAENVIKQKEKYIQMLINRKNNGTFYNHKNKEQENKEQNINNNGNNSKRYARPQSFGIKNRNILTKQGGKNYDIGLNENNAVIIEQDNIIKKLKEKIAHLEKDNAGLLIRLKNNNNLKTIKK